MARSRKGKSDALMLAGMLARGAVGAAVMLFYTPVNGEENRKRLSEWAGHRAGEARDKAESVLPGSDKNDK